MYMGGGLSCDEGLRTHEAWFDRVVAMVFVVVGWGISSA